MDKISPTKVGRIFICFCLAMLAISPLVPDGNRVIPKITPQVQNILHVPVFAILSILLFIIFNGYGINRLRSILLILLISQAVSMSTELIQLFIPGRCPSFGDIRANFFGTAIGISFIYGTIKIRSVITRAFFS